MTGRLADKRVLVVGAGTQTPRGPDPPVGNGRAIAIAAARQGAMVICVDRDREAADETATRIAGEGGEASVVVGDVSSAEACAGIVAEATQGGLLDGVVLNVGIGRGKGGMAGTTVEDWDATFAVNLRSHFLLAQAAFDCMSEGGAFVFIGSVAGLRPGSRLPAYDASKAGLVGLCRHVALEGARRGLRANVVAPGLIDTPLGRAASGARSSRGRTPIPLGRQGTAWEVAAATLFLLAAEASYITGQVLAVDGGLGLI